MSGYRALAGAEPHPSSIAPLEHELRPRELPILAARLGHFQVGLDTHQIASALLTDQRLLISTAGLLRTKLRYAFELADIAGTASGPLHGAGPTWVVQLELSDGRRGAAWFDGPLEAEGFEQALRSGAATASRGADADGRLQRMHE